MPRSVVFPYSIALREGGAVDTFPAVEVHFITKEHEQVPLLLLLDSGAAISALPRSDAAFFGVRVARGSPVRIAGISGVPVKGWRHLVPAVFAGEKIMLPVVFLNAPAPRILGRAGIFERFAIIFEERRKRSAFLHADSREAQALRGVVDAL
jgi:hypothetical protein